MDKEAVVLIDPNILKCIVGQASLECHQFLANSRPVYLAAKLHLAGKPINNRIIRQAAAALELRFQSIAPADSRLNPEPDPNALVITVQTRFGIGRYHYLPPLNETFSVS